MLRGDDRQNLRDYLITTAARLMGERGSAGLGVREIAREAQVADGVLYNYFEDKEDLLAHALLAHVARTFTAMPSMPAAGAATVAQNLELFIDNGLAQLRQVAPAFAGLVTQPKVLTRFHAMVGGDAAFGAAPQPPAGQPGAAGPEGAADEPVGAEESSDSQESGRGLPDMLRKYLRAEQRLGRIHPAADVEAAVVLAVGAIHGEVLPQVMFSPPGARPGASAPGLAARLAATMLAGIAPPAR